MTRVSEPLLLGIDAGGTKTVALLATLDGALIGRGAAGPANYQQVGLEAAGAQLDASIAAAFEASGRPFRVPAGVCLGLAGVGRPEDREAVTDWAAARLPGAALLVVTDAALVLAAGTPAGWGVALICGTGSIAIAAHPDGRTARVGGWGPLLGDEGSGYAVGQAALRAVMRGHDGRGPATALTDAILAHWQLPSPAALVGRVYRAGLTHAEVARLAELTDRAAADGDRVALEIMADAGAELAAMVAAAARGLGLAAPVPAALAGGLLINSTALRAAFLAAANGRGVWLDPVTRVPLPAQGALKLARQLLTA